MSIKGFDRKEFMSVLHEVLSAANPIDNINQLFGRAKQVDDIEMALHAKGRHAFIYGDRGVGKTSLAHSVAYVIQSSDNKPILVSGEPTSTLASITRVIMAYAKANVDTAKYNRKFKLGPSFMQYEHTSEVNGQPTDFEIVDTLTAALSLNSLSEWHSETPVIVLDEFDQVPESVRGEFGILLKQLGDMGSKVKIIFTGIGDSLNDLLHGHLSSSRQLHQVKLDVLPWDGRYAIIKAAFDRFGVKIPDDIRYKIAGLSDGFPSYVHLLCEMLLKEAFRADVVVEEVTHDQFITALNEAIESVAETLRNSYDKATLGRSEHLHHILWAMADSADLIREYSHIYFSYKKIMEVLDTRTRVDFAIGEVETVGIEILDEKKFKQEFSKLKQEKFGCIVENALGSRRGWFKFSENIIRGFVRMVAEGKNVTLDFERNFTAMTASTRVIKTKSSYSPLTPVEHQADKARQRSS
ncbi:AAA family ATPase [Photobacterium sp. R1]